MNRIRLFIWAASLMLAACASVGDRNRNTIATLAREHIEVKEEKIEGGLEKAMQSYQRFLEETPDSALAPEAMRRLADLKIEKEYGTITEGAGAAEEAKASPALEPEMRPEAASAIGAPPEQASAQIPAHGESETDFEKRATMRQTVDRIAAAADTPVAGTGDLERTGAREAIVLYQKLLDDYPNYKRNDQVLYQMSRAYEELGQTEEAMAVMDRVVREYPRSRYFDELQFRRAEYFFMHRRYLDAENAYESIVDMGAGLQFYELALYKLGWTFYKQELYEDALHRFIALMDHKVSVGYDFEQTEDEQERKRTDDTFRVISLSFSNLGGADSAVEYFSRHGKRSYEDSIYSNLGEFYFDKRRYADAAAAYNAFVDRNRLHKAAPNFHMRVIEIHAAGGFPSLVLDSKKKFATTYGLQAEYWKYFAPGERPDVLGLLKTNLTDLANHYHACYQDPKQGEDKPANFEEARKWYGEFLTSFPADPESPAINYQLADLLLENRSFGEAAVEFEKTAYDYPAHEKTSQAGFAAVAAYREQLAASPADEDAVKREVVRSSLKFADAFPEHEKAAIVLGAAADDLYGMKEYEQARAAANRLIEAFPGADTDVVREAWLVVGHSSYELSRYSEAEGAYLNVLSSLPADDTTRDAVVNNLAASIYKQGEQANVAQDYRAAADHFLRVSRVAPTSTIRPTAEYDAAAALIQLKDWETAASVLVGFRNHFPDNPLQPEVTKKVAYVYRENNQLSLAAREYERIETESGDDEIRRDALLVAAELHEKDNNSARALEVYRRFVGYFPQPAEPNLETRNKIAEILKAQKDRTSYLEELENIVAIDASAGSERTPRTRYLAAQAALVLAEQEFNAFAAVDLVQPFEVNMQKKRELMKTATQKFNQLVDYEIGDITAAATFYLAETYANFSKALTASERPEGLSPMEREQYELAIEEQAYPFEEKAIEVHESNLKLVSRGVYNAWIEKSLQKLAEFVPARYDKPEEASGIISSADTYVFAIDRPIPADSHVAKSVESVNAPPAQAQEPGSVTESDIAAPAQAGEPVATTEPETAPPAQVQEPESETESDTTATPQAEQPRPVMGPDTAAPAKAEEPVSVMEPETAAPAQSDRMG
ncbi:MAG TPA: tetratricopeptide repeat protein, partial [Woeseiaceae bacterium]|nr:tetratricopeptide repeat protein [Woeseiaceae bacterium]